MSLHIYRDIQRKEIIFLCHVHNNRHHHHNFPFKNKTALVSTALRYSSKQAKATLPFLLLSNVEPKKANKFLDVGRALSESEPQPELYKLYKVELEA